MPRLVQTAGDSQDDATEPSREDAAQLAPSREDAAQTASSREDAAQTASSREDAAQLAPSNLPEKPAEDVGRTSETAFVLGDRVLVVVAAAGALAHFAVVPVLHAWLRDRGIDRAEYVQSFLAFATYVLAALSVIAGALRLIFFTTPPAAATEQARRHATVIFGLRSAIAGMAPAVIVGAVGVFLHRAPPLVATLYGAVSAFSLLVAGALAARRPRTRAPALVLLAVALAGLLRLSSQKAAVVSGVEALQNLYAVALVLAGAATIVFALAVLVSILWGARIFAPRERFVANDVALSENTPNANAIFAERAYLHGALAVGFGLAWGALRGLGEHGTPASLALAIGLDGACIAPHAGALLGVGRLVAPLALTLGSAYALLALRRAPSSVTFARIAVAAALLGGARLDAPLSALLSVVAALALFRATDAEQAPPGTGARIDWTALLAKRE